jgi:hypothetical protein
MNALSRTLTLCITTVALAGIVAVAWRAAHSVPDLKLPVVVQEAFALADGGSVQIVVAGSDGRQVVVGVRGSLDAPPKNFPVFIQRWYPTLKFPVYLEVGGEQELCLLSRLVAWEAGTSATDVNRAALSEIIRKVSVRQPQYRTFPC